MSRIPLPVYQTTTPDGHVASNCKLYFYENESDPPVYKNTYSDPELSTANTNPIILGDSAYTPDIFGDGLYTVVCTDANDVQLWARDNVNVSANQGQFNSWSTIPTYAQNAIVRGPDGNYYRSISNGNKGHNPVSSPEYWEQIIFLTVWNEYVSYSEDAIVIWDGKIWRSLDGDNLGNEPIPDSLYWFDPTAVSTSGEPVRNLIGDSGRMSPCSATALLLPGAFEEPDLLGTHNGGSWSEGGKFIYDNSTNGGGEGALDPDVQSLLTAMNRTGDDARYGVEFFIGEYTAGPGTSDPSTGTDATTRYLCFDNGPSAIFGSGNNATFAAYIRVTSGSAHIGVAYTNAGVDKDAGTPLGTNTWERVELTSTSANGIDSLFPYLYATDSAVIEIALPFIGNGEINLGPYVTPIASGGGGSSGSGGDSLNFPTDIVRVYTSADEDGSNDIAVNLDCSQYKFWMLDFDGSPTPTAAGDYILNIINLPTSATNEGFAGQVWMERAGRKTVDFTLEGGMTESWAATPSFGSGSGDMELVAFYWHPGRPTTVNFSVIDART